MGRATEGEHTGLVHAKVLYLHVRKEKNQDPPRVIIPDVGLVSSRSSSQRAPALARLLAKQRSSGARKKTQNRPSRGPFHFFPPPFPLLGVVCLPCAAACLPPCGWRLYIPGASCPGLACAFFPLPGLAGTAGMDGVSATVVAVPGVAVGYVTEPIADAPPKCCPPPPCPP